MYSTDKSYFVSMQTDGNLVVYKNTNPKTRYWDCEEQLELNHITSSVSTGVLSLLYNQGADPSKGNKLLCTNVDGRLMITTTDATYISKIKYLSSVTSNVQTQLNNRALNSHTHTALGNGSYTLSLQTDGNLVIYNDGSPIWSSNDGKLV